MGEQAVPDSAPSAADALAARTGPPRVRLLGRDGVGKQTLAAALTSRGVPAGTDPPADVALYCFAGNLRATDRAAIATLQQGDIPVVVALTKADSAGSWRAADARAAQYSSEIGQPVVAVMALLDGVSAADVPAITTVAESGRRLPESLVAVAELLGSDTDLLTRWGGYGLACAVGSLRENPEQGAEKLIGQIRELGGVDLLLEPLSAAVTGFENRRAQEFDRYLQALAATDCARRDRVEQLALDRLVR